MNTVVIENDEIHLNSFLDEYSFGKTNYFSLLSETGYVFENNDFTPWSFTEIHEFKDKDDSSVSTVFYCGKNPLLSASAKTLLKCFEDDDKDLFYKVEAVLKAYTKACENDVHLPNIGAGAIIVDDSFSKVLFLPESIFQHSVHLLPKEKYFYEDTAWINETVSENLALFYKRAVLTYRFLTKTFPFTNTNEEDKNQDIFDKKYLPLELCVPGIDNNFAKNINRALELSSTNLPSKEKGKFTIDFDFDAFSKSYELSKTLNISAEEIAEKNADYIKNQDKKINTKRKMRKNTTAFIIAGCVALFVLIMSINTVNHQKEQITSRGLSSTEVIQAFFMGMNNKALNIMNPLAKGDGPNKHIDNVTEMYVLEKQVMGFARDSLFTNPAQWIMNATDNERFLKIRVYGVTNLKIDGEDKPLEVELYTKKDKPEPVTEEGGKVLEQDDTTTHDVSFYTIQTNPNDYSLFIEKVSEIHTLTYKNNKWLLTDIESVKEEIPVNIEEFKKDYFTALAKNQNDVLLAVDSIRTKYPWLPTHKTIEDEYIKLVEMENLGL